MCILVISGSECKAELLGALTTALVCWSDGKVELWNLLFKGYFLRFELCFHFREQLLRCLTIVLIFFFILTWGGFVLFLSLFGVLVHICTFTSEPSEAEPAVSLSSISAVVKIDWVSGGIAGWRTFRNKRHVHEDGISATTEVETVSIRRFGASCHGRSRSHSISQVDSLDLDLDVIVIDGQREEPRVFFWCKNDLISECTVLAVVGQVKVSFSNGNGCSFM